MKRQLISFLQHGEETGALKEGLKTMLEEIEFLTGPDLIQQGQLEVILSPCHSNQTSSSHQHLTNYLEDKFFHWSLVIHEH